ncbi:MAG: T9SS type A sorting domain-containing protein, partial [Bacteriodetes bacterium]|nr:T9SS type A sorting domain-containing protein [Bacteroidota bacterium]
VTVGLVGSTATSATYCQNSTGGVLEVKAPTSGITSYQWLLAGVNITGATNATFTIPTGTTGSFLYCVRITDACGTRVSNEFPVTVVANPTPTITSTGNALCTGYTTSITLSTQVFGSYQWMLNGSAIAGATAQSYTLPTGLAAGTYNYTVVASNSGCQTTSSVKTITISTTPNPTLIATNATYCTGSGSTPVLSVTGGPYTTYQWKLNGVNITGATNATYSLPTNLTAGTYQYCVTVTNGSCTATSQTQVITVTSGVTATVTGGGTICSGGTKNITFTLTSGNTANWSLVYSINGVQYTVNAISQASYTISVSPSTTTTYAIVSVSSNGCSSTSTASTTVTVGQTPAAQTITTTDGVPATACWGQSKTYTIPNIVSGNTYTWSVTCTGTCNHTTSQTASNQLVVNYNANGTSQLTCTITVTETSPGGCTRTNTVTTVVYPKPTVITPVASSTTLCTGQNAVINLPSSQSGVTYKLYEGTTQIGSSITGTGGVVTWTVTTPTAGSHTYTVKAVNVASCENTMGNVTVTVNAAPTVTMSTSTPNVCPNTTGSVTFAFTGTGPWTLTYNTGGSNTTVTTSVNPYVVTPTCTSTTTFNVVSVSNSSCTGSISGATSLTINVYGIPTQNFVMGFNGDQATANGANKVTFWDNYAGGGSNFPDASPNTTSNTYRPTLYANYAALNYHAGIYFDGGDKPLDVTVNTGSGISGGTQKSWFMLYRPTSTAPNTRMVIYKQGDANHGFIVYAINGVIYYGAWNNQTTNTTTNKWSVFHNTGFTVTGGSNYILQLVYNGNASASNRLRFSINGTMYTPTGTAGTSMDYSGDMVSIGGVTGDTRFHDGASIGESNEYKLNNTKIAEVLLYSTADKNVRDQVWCVLKNKYAISVGNNPIGVLAKSHGDDDEEVIAGEPVQGDQGFELSAAHPNPGVDYTNFTLAVDQQQMVRITVLNELGQEIMVVHEGVLQRRTQNGFTVEAAQLPSGTYTLRVQGENFTTMRQFVIVK